jgi:hypothetical protein
MDLLVTTCEIWLVLVKIYYTSLVTCASNYPTVLTGD